MPMDAKRYLQQIQKIDKMIENKIAEARRWKAIATSTTTFADGDRVQSSSGKDKMADAVCRYISMDMEVTADIDNLISLKQEVIKLIEQLPTVEYDVLHKIYVQYLEIYEVADILGKSYSWVTTIHGRALTNVQRLLDAKVGAEELNRRKSND